MKRWQVLLFRAAIAGIVLSAAGGAFVLANPSTPLAKATLPFLLYCSHRSRNCSALLVVKCTFDEWRMERCKQTAVLTLLKSDGRFSQWKTPLGAFWSSRDGGDGDLVQMLSEHVADVYNLRSVRPGAVVLDCGANVGFVTRDALSHGAATVVAIEPDPDSLECLKRNFSSDIQQGKVIVCPKGVWHKNDVLRLAIPRDTSQSASFVLRQDSPGILAPLTTIDDICHQLKLSRVDLIKMDIQGAERNALLGAAETIRRFHPRLAISAYHLRDDSTRIPEIVASLASDYRLKCSTCETFDERGQRELRPKVFEFF